MKRIVMEYLIEKMPQWNLNEMIFKNKSGILFLCENEKNKYMSLFITKITKNRNQAIHLYKKIVEQSQKKLYLVKCYQMNIIKHNDVEFVIITMEPLTVFTEKILEGEFDEYGENKRREIVLRLLIDICDCRRSLDEEFPEINTYINNEQVCVTDSGQGKLFTLDMISNEIEVNNPLREMKILENKIAGAMNVKITHEGSLENLQELKDSYTEQLKKTIDIQEQEQKRLDKYLKMSERKNAKALYNVARIYEKGKAGKCDYKKALQYYKQSANLGYAPAYNNMAYMYHKGLGVEKDFSKAKCLLERGAKEKHDIAQLNLGMVYQLGKGVEQDYKKALYWYKKSMKNGNEMAKRMYQRLCRMKND